MSVVGTPGFRRDREGYKRVQCWDLIDYICYRRGCRRGRGGGGQTGSFLEERMQVY